MKMILETQILEQFQMNVIIFEFEAECRACQGRHDIQHNDTQHNGLLCDPQHTMAFGRNDI
jgi:hypothetical protein